MKPISLALACACFAITLAIIMAGHFQDAPRPASLDAARIAESTDVVVSKADVAEAHPGKALAVADGVLLDGFEGLDYSVWAFDAADDEADSAYVAEGATQGKSALRLNLRGKGAAGKLHLRREVAMDLSRSSALRLDITAPEEGLSAALALKTSPGDAYQEIKPVTLRAGLNKGVRFALDQKIWKNAKTNWEYSGPPVDLQAVQRLILLLNTGAASQGSFLLDNLRVEGTLIRTPEDARMVYREWRPEIVALTTLPVAAPLFATVDLRVAFRASYRDVFDSNDIAVGLHMTTPSGRELDVPGFFRGLSRLNGAGQEAESVAPHAAWGPFKTPDDTREGGAAKAGGVEALPGDVLPVWSVRFTPEETGRYTWQVYVRNAVGETRAAERSLVVAPGNSDPPGRKGGNVRVSRHDSRQLELQDGTPFYIVGQNVCWTNAWDAYLDKMRAYGANTCRIWLCPWGLNLERTDAPGMFDPVEAERVDALMARAEATGVRILFCFTFHGANGDEWHRSPYNQANGGPCARPEEFFTDSRARRQFRRLLAYAAARWGASPAILSWELMNELDLARYDRSDDACQWAREMAGYLKRVDVHRHLVTVSVSRPEFQPALWEDSPFDFISVHGYGKDVGALMDRTLNPFLALRKPLLVGEFGGGWNAADDIPDQDGARLQAALWLSACSPSCGLVLPWWWDSYIEARGLYPVLAAAGRFVAGEDRRGRFSESVRKELGRGAEVRGIMDVSGGRFYVHHSAWTRLAHSGSGPLLAAPATMEMSGVLDGDFRIEFWDARTGKVFDVYERTARNAVLQVELPAHAGAFGVKVERKERARLELR